MIQDLRYASRSLLRQPSLALGVVMALALGIGAAVAVFSVMRGVLWDPFDYAEPHRVVAVREHLFDVSPYVPMSPAEVVTLRRQARTVEDIATVDLLAFTDVSGETPERFDGAVVTENLLELLGVEAAEGRLFGMGDGDQPVAVLSWNLWQRRYGGDVAVLGRTLRLRWSAGYGPPRELGSHFTVIGILPRGFEAPIGSPDIWVPRAFGAGVGETTAALDVFHYIFPFARLAPATEIAAAQAELSELLAAIERGQQEGDIHRAGVAATVEGVGESRTRSVRSAFTLFVGATALVLLLACANASGLLMGRVALRRVEWAVRSALGASRRRLARLQLAESLLLAISAGIAAVVVALGCIAALRLLAPGNFPRLDRVAIKGPEIALALLLAVAAALSIGWLPAWAAGRQGRSGGRAEGIAMALRRERSGSRFGLRLRRSLVVTQVALAIPMLLLAGSLVDGVQRLLTLDLGLDARPVLSFRVAVDGDFDVPQTAAFHRELLERLGAVPGVIAVSLTDRTPMQRISTVSNFAIDGGGRDDGTPERLTMPVRSIGPGYFRSLGIPHIAGEAPGLQHLDVEAANPLWVNESFARQVFGDQPAVGQRLRYLGGSTEQPWRTILGVVGDAQEDGPDREPQATAYQLTLRIQEAAYVVRGAEASTLAQLATPLRDALREVDPQQAAYDLAPVTTLIDRRLARPRFVAALASSFGLVALLLASLGLFASMSYAVSRRYRELAVRRALGAQERDLQRLILGEGLVLVSVGTVLGGCLALAVSRVVMKSRLAEWLRDVPSAGLEVVCIVAVGVFLVALLALLLPARRAARVALAATLRQP